MTSNGTVREYNVPTPASGVQSIVSGPDDALWFTEKSAAKIGRISIHGEVNQFVVPSGAAPLDITVGPDGALWFTESSPNQFTGDRIGRITLHGVVSEFGLPAQYAMNPVDIVTGPVGALWFSNYADGAIGRIAIRA
jgi:virginiamycin B lyase